MANTTEIINEFVSSIDKTKEYDLKELKELLTEAFNAKKTKKARKIKNTEDKPKKAPSAYNNFVKQTMLQIKTDEPETPANELMKKAAAKWKTLTKAQQESYKIAV